MYRLILIAQYKPHRAPLIPPEVVYKAWKFMDGHVLRVDGGDSGSYGFRRINKSPFAPLF